MRTTAPALPFLLLSLLQAQDPRPALGGLDPVALCEGRQAPGRAELAQGYAGHHYHFADERSRDRFRQTPQRFAIQWGGACARMGALSGRGDPQRYAVHQGRIYVFASDACRAGFLRDPAQHLELPDPRPVTDPTAAAAGRKLLAAAMQAHGGAVQIDACRSLELRTHGTYQGWRHGRTTTLCQDGRISQISRWTPPKGSDQQGSRLVMVHGPQSFSIERGKLREILSKAESRALRRVAHRHPLTLFWQRKAPGFIALDRGTTKFGGRESRGLEIHVDGLSTTLHLDPESSRVLGITWRGRLGADPRAEVHEQFRHRRDKSGLLLPQDIHVFRNGKPNPIRGMHNLSSIVRSSVNEENFQRPKAPR